MEAEGIPAVVVAVAAFDQPLKKMALPRVALTPFPLERPVGPVNDAATQKALPTTALELLTTANRPTLVAYPTV